MSWSTQQEALVSRLEGIRQILMAHHAAGTHLPNAVKGAEREILLREFLGKAFPPLFRFGEGAVIDSSGAVSGQLDIVAEFPFFPSFPTPGAAARLYLAESVAFAVEVKSNLASQWQEVMDSAQKLWPLRRAWKAHIIFDQHGAYELAGPSTSRIPSLAVGYTGYKTLEDLESRLRSTPEETRPDGALVLDSGAYVNLLTDTHCQDLEGLFALCIDAAHFATNVLIAIPDFGRYFAGT